MACLQIYRELLSLTTSLRVHSNSKELSYLSWQKTYPNLKTTCQIKLKFFLWTKLLENLLVAKYLITVIAPLSNSNFSQDTVIVYKKAVQMSVHQVTTNDNEWQQMIMSGSKWQFHNEWKRHSTLQRMGLPFFLWQKQMHYFQAWLTAIRVVKKIECP